PPFPSSPSPSSSPDPPPPHPYPLSLHDALPILIALHAPLGLRRTRGHQPNAQLRAHASELRDRSLAPQPFALAGRALVQILPVQDRKSTRLNSSHGSISYAVFCLKKKNP